MREHPHRVVFPDPHRQLPETKPLGILTPRVAGAGEASGPSRGEWHDVPDGDQLQARLAWNLRVQKYLRLGRVEGVVKQRRIEPVESFSGLVQIDVDVPVGFSLFDIVIPRRGTACRRQFLVRGMP